MEIRSETLDAAKGGSAVAIVLAWFAHLSIPDWAALAALLYSLILIAEKAVHYWRKWRHGDKRRDRRATDRA